MSQRVLFGKNMTDTQKHKMTNVKTHHNTRGQNIYLAIHQVSITGILKKFWIRSVYRIDFVVLVWNMCQRNNVSEALSSVQ